MLIPPGAAARPRTPACAPRGEPPRENSSPSKVLPVAQGAAFRARALGQPCYRAAAAAAASPARARAEPLGGGAHGPRSDGQLLGAQQPGQPGHQQPQAPEQPAAVAAALAAQRPPAAPPARPAEGPRARAPAPGRADAGLADARLAAPGRAPLAAAALGGRGRRGAGRHGPEDAGPAAAGPRAAGPAGRHAGRPPRLAARADGRAPRGHAAPELQQPAADKHERPHGQRVQARGLPGPEGRGLHHRRRHDAVPAAGVRAVSEAPRGRPPHGLHQVEEARHRAARLQRRAGQDPEGPRRHTARRQSLQAPQLQGLRRSLQGLHDSQVREITLRLIRRCFSER